MRCQNLYSLFSFKEYVDVWEEGTQQKIAAHICTCTSCSQGITQLSEAVMAEDVLTCDVCCASLPGYYEATRSAHLSGMLAEVEIVQIAIHLGSCVTCAEEYGVLVALWDEEE